MNNYKKFRYDYQYNVKFYLGEINATSNDKSIYEMHKWYK